MQNLAQVWLVLVLTEDPLLVGLVTAAQSLPVATLALVGGVVADRFDKRKILVVTQASMLILALALGLLALSQQVQVWQIVVLAFALGCANAIDMPARQAFVVEMVGPEDVGSAVGLNSAIYSVGRLVGPAIGGLAIAALTQAIGSGVEATGAAFVINAATFASVIVGLLLIRPGELFAVERPGGPRTADPGPGPAGHPRWARLPARCAAGPPHPLHPRRDRDAGRELRRPGPRLRARGWHRSWRAGSLPGGRGGGLPGLRVLDRDGRYRRAAGPGRWRAPAGDRHAGPGAGGDPQVWPILLFAAGLGAAAMRTSANSQVQLAVPGAVRGRVMSVFTIVFEGFSPMGGLLVGAIAALGGAQVTFGIAGIGSLAILGLGARAVLAGPGPRAAPLNV
jgi:MFS family permease